MGKRSVEKKDDKGDLKKGNSVTAEKMEKNPSKKVYDPMEDEGFHAIGPR